MSEKVILIVDDNPDVREGLAAALERADRAIITCSDRESAEVVISRRHADFLLTDIRITPPFGFEGFDLITTFKNRNEVGVAIAMSGNISAEVVLESRRRGAVAILQKPFDVSEIEALITGETSDVC